MIRRAKKRSADSVQEEKDIPLVLPVSTSKASKKHVVFDEKLSANDQSSGSGSDHDDETKSKNLKLQKGQRKLRVLGMSSKEKRDAQEEAFLEKCVLGGQESFVKNLNRDSKTKAVIGILDAEQRKPAWEDDDDNTSSLDNDESHKKTTTTANSGVKFSQRRKLQFEKVVGSTPSWAQLKSDRRNSDSDEGSDSDAEEDRFLRRTGDYLTTSEFLPKGSLVVRKVTNANKEEYTRCNLSAMEFHPTSQVILTAGEDESLHIFQVDGKHNPKIQSVAIEHFPILSAHFSADGAEVIMSSRSRWYYVYDMMVGKIERMSFLRDHHERQPLSRFAVSPDGSFIAFLGLYGFIHLVTAKNKELICSLKMNGCVSSVAFTQDGSKLFSFGDDGEVYVWDMKTRDCIHKFVDEGCVKGTTISVSRGGQYVACGSHSGVVNIYNGTQCLTNTHPQPIKAVMNLTTSVTMTRFNHSAEILAAASFHTKAGVKLIHLPDCHVFPNFPLSSNSIGLATQLDFSPNSGYMAVGNSRGKALLYRLGHYKDY